MLSIVISWKNRVELNQSISSLIDTSVLLNGEIIIVNFDGDPAMIKDVTTHKSPYVHFLNVKNQPMFNKAAANNLGAYHARFDHIFFCDCDIIVNPSSINQLLELVMEKPNNFGTLDGVKETVVNSIQNNFITSFGYELIIKTKNGRLLNIKDHEEDSTDGTRNAPGLLLVSKQNFLTIDGYNSGLTGWGWEDQDMIGRLTLGGGFNRVYFGTAMHISHNDTERTKHYPISNRWESRDKMFRQALANYDAGVFSGTYSDDLSKYEFRYVM
jgi:GT2 family glycosyltransferase